MKKRYIIIFIVALVLIGLDQYTKTLILETFNLGESRPVIDNFFNLVRVHNRGAAFGFLNHPESDWQLWLFGAAALVTCAILLFMAKSAKADQYFFFVSLGCIISGALGNLIDRVQYRYVVDFMDIYIKNWHWPAFNVADIAICVGAGGLILSILFSDENKPSLPASVDKDKK